MIRPIASALALAALLVACSKQEEPSPAGQALDAAKD